MYKLKNAAVERILSKPQLAELKKKQNKPEDNPKQTNDSAEQSHNRSRPVYKPGKTRTAM